ncbi:hypothetical protein PR048_031993 [Dryococelus australis]|uniref:Uncharacterized protein n=1 Tax=Dryococelus australis TaxID=614101 RepID=A0ABQ9GAU2_9NEOP|nr:hypothetical protein PR048_031993 [Dryococelus australis]
MKVISQHCLTFGFRLGMKYYRCISQNASSCATYIILHKDAACTDTQLGVDLIMPCLATRQIHRANYDANSTEEYHRKYIYIPLLDSGLTDLEQPLSQDVLQCYDLHLFLLHFILKRVLFFKMVSDSEVELLQLFWVVKYAFGMESGRESKEGDPLPETVLDVIDSWDSDLFPTIRCFLGIILTSQVQRDLSGAYNF